MVERRKFTPKPEKSFLEKWTDVIKSPKPDPFLEGIRKARKTFQETQPETPFVTSNAEGRRLALQREIMGSRKQTEPHKLADEMEYAAKLHSNCFWAILMQEGADMIRKLENR